MAAIDAHHHFWNPARGDYGWMPPDDPVLSRSYTPADLDPHLGETGVTRTVLVQAAPSVGETEYLLGIADAASHVAAVVGWIDFEDRSQAATLERLAQHPKFAGVRPMVQDIPDGCWMLRGDVQWAYQALIDLDLTLDCLGFPRHLESFHRVLTRFPGLRAVLDHCLKPQLRDRSSGAFAEWSQGMARIAGDTTACCKLSGLVTEADSMPGIEDLRPYADHVLSAFGAGRIMWGSDWPVVRLRCEYADWFRTGQRLTEHLPPADRARIFRGTATDFYRLED